MKKTIAKDLQKELDDLTSDHADWDQEGPKGHSAEYAQPVDLAYWKEITGLEQDAQITLRLPSQLLLDIKGDAKQSKYRSYQRYIKDVLIESHANRRKLVAKKRAKA